MRIEFLNERLIEQQGLTEAEVLILVELHEERERIFDLMTDTDDPDLLQELAAKVETVEFALQRTWKFPEDSNWHCWWYQVPKCCCPKLDNADRWGTKYRIFNGNCPVHRMKS
jgi:hypothetical protein